MFIKMSSVTDPNKKKIAIIIPTRERSHKITLNMNNCLVLQIHLLKQIVSLFST